MLTAIKTIKNLGVFGNYSQTPGLKAFSRYNVIYGENGAGKTTLSRLFSALNEGAHTEYPLLEFAVDGESGAVAKGQKYGRKLRVFNADYVDANIGKFDSPIRPILIIGIENKELAEEVRKEQATYDARELRLKEVSAAIAKATTDKGKVFSAVARTIGEATSGVSLRSYRKPDAEKDFVRLRPLKSYLDNELEVSRATLQQEQADPVNKFGLPSQLRESDGELVSFVDACAQFSRTVESLTRKTAQETDRFDTIRSCQKIGGYPAPPHAYQSADQVTVRHLLALIPHHDRQRLIGRTHRKLMLLDRDFVRFAHWHVLI